MEKQYSNNLLKARKEFIDFVNKQQSILSFEEFYHLNNLFKLIADLNNRIKHSEV